MEIPLAISSITVESIYLQPPPPLSLFLSGVAQSKSQAGMREILMGTSFTRFTAIFPVLYLLRLARPKVCKLKCPKLYDINSELYCNYIIPDCTHYCHIVTPLPTNSEECICYN